LTDMTLATDWRAEATIVIVGDRRLARSAELAHLLCDRFAVVTYDGGELAELEALVGEAAGPVSIVGVAGGAGLALEAAARMPVERVALCEPIVDRGRLAVVAQPTLLVSCDEGGSRSRRVARALWRLLPDCQLRELSCEDADPFVVAELLEDFLAVPALAGVA
jgi:alpha-beta hydrolase superfamily lysophospholipase